MVLGVSFISSTYEQLLINEYNRALDYRNSLRTTLFTTTGISLGAIITLIAAIFTQVIITFWIYLLIPIVLVILYLIFIQTKLNDRIEKTDNYSNYIQVLLRKSTTQATPDKINQFIPFSFTFRYIKKKDQSLNECLTEFNKANPSDYLEYKEIPRKISIPWPVIGQSILLIIVITVAIVFILYYSFFTPVVGVMEQIIYSIIVSIISGLIGIIFWIIKQRFKKKKVRDK